MTMRQRTLLLLASCILVGLFPFLGLPEDSTLGIAAFFGRFHPLLLHFPIVLLLLSIVIEFWPQWSKKKNEKIPDGWKSQLLLVTVIASFVTVIGGYLLYRSGEYQGQMIRRHLWGGVLLMFTLSASLYCFWNYEKNQSALQKRLYQIFLLLAGPLLLWTSHIGGSITHGPDFLTEPLAGLRQLPPSPIEQKKTEELLVYQDLIVPALEKRCWSCHNQYKTKGGLLMTSIADLQNGGESGKAMLVAGQPEASELYHRISLPAEHEDHMPPSQKSPLSQDEIILINWWISEGANPEMLLGEGPSDPEAQATLQRYLPQLFRSERLKIRQREELAALTQELSGLGKKLGLIIEPDPGSTENLFAVSMQMPPAVVTDQTVAQLLEYAGLFSKISLPASEITDDAFFHFSKMSSLQGLYVAQTNVKGDGLIYLQELDQLEILNLSHSRLSSKSALNLTHLPQIKECYLYNTSVKPEVLEALRLHLPKMLILEEEGSYF